jgi:uncharacterized protein YodC (DUF2158 family)
MADGLHVGDVVELKSGGPPMTIEVIDDYGAGHNQAMCVWFEGAKRESAIFELATLRKKAV